jgi:hypothetical protein
MGAAVDEAVTLGAKYVSNSYGTNYDTTPGSGEPSDTTELDAHYNHPRRRDGRALGDSGYGVSFPAVSPCVTAVGGTSLKKGGATARGWSETVWHDGFDGPGSGCAKYAPKPSTVPR